MKRSVSIAYAVLFIVACGSFIGCPPDRTPRVSERIQPTHHERIVLGFTPEAEVVFVEVRDGVAPAVVAHRIGTNDQITLDVLEPTIAALVDASSASRDVIVSGLKASSFGARLEASGFVWAVHAEQPVKTELGTLRRDGVHIAVSADAATRIELATLGLPPESDLWLMSPDGRFVAIEMLYTGSPRVRDVRAFVRDSTDAQLLTLRAERAFDRGDDDAAAHDLARARALVASGDPLVGNIDYVEASLAARHHDAAACVRSLNHAIAHDRRYRDRAARDRAFDTIRHAPEMVGLFATSP